MFVSELCVFVPKMCGNVSSFAVNLRFTFRSQFKEATLDPRYSIFFLNFCFLCFGLLFGLEFGSFADWFIFRLYATKLDNKGLGFQ